jgi:hypothetical protein
LETLSAESASQKNKIIALTMIAIIKVFAILMLAIEK